jgi:hypothetical protein
MNPNIQLLERAAAFLEPILPEIVFVGGTLTGILVTDPGAALVRTTKDVDVVAQIAGEKGYRWASQKMLQLGFGPDRSEGAPVCRWKKEEVPVDLMGTGETPFGPTNPWYELGWDSRISHTLPSGRTIQILHAPVWILTKWVAFQSRGEGDMAGSPDIEDLVSVLDGRPELTEEIRGANFETRKGLAEFARLAIGSDQFMNHCLASLNDRADLAEEVLRQMLAPRAG